MTRKRYSELDRPARVRKVAASLLGSAASLTLLIVIYYAARWTGGWIPAP